MADEAEHTESAPAMIAVADVKALLAEYEHDFIGKAHEIVQGLKALMSAAEAPAEKAA